MNKTGARGPAPPELTLERRFAHPPEAVFRAWTDERALRQWMGPGAVTAPEATMEPRVGGALVVPMIEPDGKLSVARGTVLELVPNRRLRFTWAWDPATGGSGQVMEITLDFHPDGDGTRLVLRQTNFVDARARDLHREGWTGCFDKLAGYLAV